jgi:hypothetical protein
MTHKQLFQPSHPGEPSQLPAFTVGSLATKIKVECMLTAIEEIILSDAPVQRLRTLLTLLKRTQRYYVSRKNIWWEEFLKNSSLFRH